ncbi:MAG TPA: YIP1 family protein [Vicinamibacterales bacterium]|nr:YIP1 family protein [Vicinamibacterales bacterium]
MITLTYRLMAAALLDGGMYEEIEHDKRATAQAALVVLLSSLAAGIGASASGGLQPLVLLGVAAVALATWLAWAVLIFHFGAGSFREPQTQTSVGELLRTVGFAAAPGLLQVFAIIPPLTVPIFVVTWLWMFGAMVIAVRHALDFTTTRRAVAVCAAALAATISVAIVLGLLFGPVVH